MSRDAHPHAGGEGVVQAIYQLGRVRATGPFDGAWLWFECAPPIAPDDQPGYDGDGNLIPDASKKLGRQLLTSIYDPTQPGAAVCVKADAVELYAAFATGAEVEVGVPPSMLRAYLARARAGHTIGRHRLGEALPFKVLEWNPGELAMVGRPSDEELH